ncbi:MAG: D-alanyl-D-alanine carboxypeptidase [Patescibacteria group bacterium]|nr:D-alanyl-D-alanine carboxypeptidase [Patescibacteria group bacterium]
MHQKSLFLVIFLALLVAGAYLLLTLHPSAKLISPWTEKEKIADNLWFPLPASSSFNDAPQLTAEAAYFIDTDTGRVLFQKNPHSRLPIASLTKIMTVIVTLENKDWNDEISISTNAANMEPDHMELIAGEKLTVEELLDGIFLISANDSAEALAENATGNRDNFIKKMNEKTIELGLKDTLFINPTGLEEDGRQQYSSAFDVALISRYAITHFPHLVDISSKPHIYLDKTPTHQDYDLNSGINLLTTYPGVVGFKTGYTPEAGLTLVTLARRGGHQVLGVILNSQDRRDEARELLDYSFKNLGV